MKLEREKLFGPVKGGMEYPLVQFEWLVKEQIQFDQNKMIENLSPVLANSSTFDCLVHGKAIENKNINLNWQT